MARFFNTTGVCEPRKHYMIPAEARVTGLRQLIDKELYFVVHAPRQVGKSTSLRALAESLTAEGHYAALHTSCEAGQKIRPDLEGSINAILEILLDRAQHFLTPELRPPAINYSAAPETRLYDLLARWAESSPQPVVLFLDEIDALYDDALISVLRQLRSGYDLRPGRFPHAVALIGMRDVRDYKVLGHNGSEEPVERTLGTASPFNIKSDSLRLPNFTAAEVATLYEQHTEETGQIFLDETKTLAFTLTQGQPWLVNALARQVIETVVPDRQIEITPEHLAVAKEILVRRRDTHLDSLLDRLRETRVRRVLEPILAGESPDPEVFDDDYLFVEALGLVTTGPTGLEIANPIYQEIIPRALTAVAERFVPMQRAAYVEEDGGLDWNALLDGFASFWKQNAEWMLRQQPYSEAAAQMIFMAFLHRLVNGPELDVTGRVATVDREFAVGSGRIDMLVRWPLPDGNTQQFAVEMKVRRDKDGDPLEDGILQLSEYLDRLGLETGTLLLFDLRGNAPPMAERCSRTMHEHGQRKFTIQRL